MATTSVCSRWIVYSLTDTSQSLFTTENKYYYPLYHCCCKPRSHQILVHEWDASFESLNSHSKKCVRSVVPTNEMLVHIPYSNAIGLCSSQTLNTGKAKQSSVSNERDCLTLHRRTVNSCLVYNSRLKLLNCSLCIFSISLYKLGYMCDDFWIWLDTMFVLKWVI